VNQFDDNYFDNNDEVRIVYVIYIWFGDSFDDDDYLLITMKWRLRWVILSLIVVDEW